MRKWRQLGLKNAPRKLLTMVMSVPLAPHTLFEECFTILQYVADAMFNDYPAVLQFMTYLRKTWLSVAKKVSVYGCPVRTNNLVESFHNTISKKFGSPHPNVWIFIGWYFVVIIQLIYAINIAVICLYIADKLQKVIIDQEIDLRRLQNNLQARRRRSRADKEKDNIILQKQKDLVENR